jgi:fibronectin type 3 domain-containing protein
VNGDGWPDIVGADYNNGLVVLSNSQVFQPTEPGAPTLTAAAGGDGRVTLQWTAPANDGGAAISSYYAEAAPGGAYCLVSGLACQISGLTNGQSYTFTVRAGNSVGLGEASNALTATPFTLPSVPRTLAASPNLAAGVGLTWQAPTSTGDPALQGYRIYRGVSGGALVLHATVNANAVSFTDTAVVNGGSYAYQIAAFSTFGEGPRTSAVAAQRGTAPSAPRTLAAQVAAKAINLSWVAPVSNGGTAITEYRIYRGTTAANKVRIATLSASTLAYADKALTKKTKYFYWVTAVNVLGESSPSNEVTATAR